MIENYGELERNPNVASVDNVTIRLKTEFRIYLYQMWRDHGRDAVKEELKRRGIPSEWNYRDYAQQVISGFEMGGYPIGKGKEEISLIENHPLVRSGRFRMRGNGRGIEIVPAFKEKLIQQHPEMGVEESLVQEGIDPIDMGYNRLHKLKEDIAFECSDKHSPEEYWSYEEETNEYSGRDYNNLPEAQQHPYVKEASLTRIVLKSEFYQEAHTLLSLGTEKILDIFELQHEWFTEQEKMKIGLQLSRWNAAKGSTETVLQTEQTLRIWQNREKAMTQLVSDRFKHIQELLIPASFETRRSICRQINEMPRDPWKYYTTQKILEEIGMPRSTYYELLHNESYGKGAENRARREEEDFLVIQQVADYKGFAKGYRQISMMTEPITGQYISPNRVLTLMRKYGMRTTIRRPSKNRKAMKELLERNGKPNLLLRQFKLHRPNEVRLTDVTYLDYGNSLRAYGSASIDPVTGRLICFVVSENNDLQLALDTLAAMDKYPAVNGGLIHSDQGILYFTDDFQAAVRDRNLIQSMSRRGNCWDNAPQESFFGHFKDESGYKKCRNLEELRRKVEEYGVYYNEERRIWSRNKMTPLEYEEYLTNMDEESFAAYLVKEEATYRKMKDQSARKAMEKAKKQQTGRGE